MRVESRPQELNVFETLGVPTGWLEAQKRAAELAYDPISQSRRWEERTGLPPEESVFTVILPIHNESRYLHAALGALMFSDIPDAAHMNVVLVTNACTDRSVQIVRDFMKAVRLSNNPRSNWTFKHIDTDTPGKANALNLGNAEAIQNGHRIAMCIDANNFVEHDALPIMFREAYRSIVGLPEEGIMPDGTAVLSAQPIQVKKRSDRSKVMTYAENKAKERNLIFPNLVSGCLMVWDTEFVDQEGGIPQTLVEDGSLGLLARSKGRTVRKISDANIWGYDVDNLLERWQERVRYMAGTFQSMDLSPEIAALIQTEEPEIVGGFKVRVKHAAEVVRQNKNKNKNKMPYDVLRLLVREAVRIRAKALVRKNPPTWKISKSTK